MPYRFFLQDSALVHLQSLQLRRRRRLLDAFYAIADYAEHPESQLFHDEVGRRVHVRVIGDWAIRYYIDDPVKSVLIVEFEPFGIQR